MFEVRGVGVSHKRDPTVALTQNTKPNIHRKTAGLQAIHKKSTKHINPHLQCKVWDFVVKKKWAILSRDFGQNFVVETSSICQTRNPQPQGTSIGPIHMLEHHILSVERKDMVTNQPMGKLYIHSLKLTLGRPWKLMVGTQAYGYVSFRVNIWWVISLLKLTPPFLLVIFPSWIK